jgi:hypothetical protein
MGNWWGTDLPTWLVGIGTIGAFATGGAVLLRELGRDRRREEDEEKRQASSVAAWPIRVENLVEPLRTLTAYLVLNNASSEPVYQVRIEYELESGSHMVTDEVDILPPGRSERELPKQLQETWVNSADGWIKRGSTTGSPIRKPQYQSWEFRVAISFVDAGGRRWCRGSDGSLTRHENGRSSTR